MFVKYILLIITQLLHLNIDKILCKFNHVFLDEIIATQEKFKALNFVFVQFSSSGGKCLNFLSHNPQMLLRQSLPLKSKWLYLQIIPESSMKF